MNTSKKVCAVYNCYNEAMESCYVCINHLGTTDGDHKPKPEPKVIPVPEPRIANISQERRALVDSFQVLTELECKCEFRQDTFGLVPCKRCTALDKVKACLCDKTK